MSKTIENYSISTAINDAISELFSKNRIDFDFIIAGKFSTHLRDDFNKIRIESKVKIIKTSRLSCELILNKVFVLFLDSIETLKEILNLQCFQKFNEISPAAMDLKYLVYIEKNFSMTEIDVKKPNFMFGEFLHFAYFIINSSTGVQLKTFEWWTSKSCDKTQFVTVDTFNQKWRPKIPRKFKNFHNCTLNVHSAAIDLNLMKSQQRYGLPLTKRYHNILAIRDAAEAELSKIFGDQGNYKVNQLKYFERDKFQVEHIIEKFMPKSKTHVGSFFTDDIISLMMPRAMFNSSYEKMVLPFDHDTWIYLLITFGVGFIVIVIINMTPRWFRDFIYGKGVKGAEFNLIGTFFGIGQTKEPENYTGRILLLFFIIFCLIFRTAYQGVFFTMMTTDIRKPQPTTILELKERNFTVYTLDDLGQNRQAYVSSKIDPKIRPRILRCNFWDIGLKFLLLLKTDSNIAITTDTADFRTLGAVFKVKPDVLEEKIITETHGLQVYKNNFMFRHIEDVMQWLIVAGIPQQHFKFVLETALWRVEPLPPAPQVFGMKDLEFGFVTWLVTCGISICVFVVEILLESIKRNVLFLLGLDGILRILRNKMFL